MATIKNSTYQNLLTFLCFSIYILQSSWTLFLTFTLGPYHYVSLCLFGYCMISMFLMKCFVLCRKKTKWTYHILICILHSFIMMIIPTTVVDTDEITLFSVLMFFIDVIGMCVFFISVLSKSKEKKKRISAKCSFITYAICITFILFSSIVVTFTPSYSMKFSNQTIFLPTDKNNAQAIQRQDTDSIKQGIFPRCYFHYFLPALPIGIQSDSFGSLYGNLNISNDEDIHDYYILCNGISVFYVGFIEFSNDDNQYLELQIKHEEIDTSENSYWLIGYLFGFSHLIIRLFYSIFKLKKVLTRSKRFKSPIISMQHPFERYDNASNFDEPVDIALKNTNHEGEENDPSVYPNIHDPKTSKTVKSTNVTIDVHPPPATWNYSQISNVVPINPYLGFNVNNSNNLNNLNNLNVLNSLNSLNNSNAKSNIQSMYPFSS